MDFGRFALHPGVGFFALHRHLQRELWSTPKAQEIAWRAVRAHLHFFGVFFCFDAMLMWLSMASQY
jgi:hypothetical protein